MDSIKVNGKSQPNGIYLGPPVQDPEKLLVSNLDETKVADKAWNIDGAVDVGGIIADKQTLFKQVLHYAELATHFGENLSKIDKASLYNALKLLSGKEPNESNIKELDKFLDGLRGKDVDESVVKQMLSIWAKPVGPTKPSEPTSPRPDSNDPRSIIEGAISDAKEIAKGNKPSHPISKEKLYDALAKTTGLEITEERKAAIDKFIDAVSKDKPADVNGTRPTDINDILIVWNTGSFVPVAIDPVNEIPESTGGTPSHDNPDKPANETKPPVTILPYPLPTKPPVSGPGIPEKGPITTLPYPAPKRPDFEIQPFQNPENSKQPVSPGIPAGEKKPNYPIAY